MLKSVSGILFTLLLLTVACKKDTSGVFDCTGVTPTYTADIKSILDANCAQSGCHSASYPAAGINLSTYAAAKEESLNGKVLASIQHSSGVRPMPEDASKLNDATIKQVYCWIENGAPQ